MSSPDGNRPGFHRDARGMASWDHARDAIFLADDTARIVDVNPAASALLGYSRDELLERSIWDIVPFRTIEEGRRLWSAFVAGGPLSGEYPVRRQDGGQVTVEIASVAEVCPGIHLTIARDVSERLRHARSLEASEQRYRTILAHAPLVLIAVDAEGRFTVSEGRGLEAVGLKPGQSVGRSAADLYGDLEIVERSGRILSGREVVARALAGETIVGTLELNGRFFENTFLPIRQASGAIDGMMGVSYDVTDLHRAAGALRASEDRFRRLVENVSDIITMLDARGTILYESPSVERVLGYRQMELVGRNAFELVHPDDLPDVLRAFDAMRPDVVVRQFRFRHRDGSWRTLEAVGRAHDAADGTRTAIVVSRDLTDRDRGAAESRLLQEVTWRVAEAADTDAALASVMRLACDTFGWAFAEAWVQSEVEGWFDLSPVWHSVDRRFDRFREDPAGSQIAPGAGLAGQVWAEKRPVWIPDVAEAGGFLRRDGARAAGLHAALAVPITVDDPASAAAVLVLYSARVEPEDARLVGLFSTVAAQLGTAMQRKRAEMALRSSQDLLQSVVTSAPIIVFALDQKGIFTLSAGKGLDALGLEPNQLLGVSAFEHYRDAPQVVDALRRALAGETFVASADVAGRSYETWYSPRVDANGTVTGVLGVATDLTERRQLEEQLRQSQKLESVGLLAGGIAHDFNNMLTAITGYADLVMDDLPPGDRRRDDVAEISRAAQKAALLTSQLLAFSRKQILRPEALNLNDAVIDVSRMLRRVIGEDIALVTSMGEGLGLVNADPGQVAQVLMNLAVNARDAMPNGGTLTIETANVDLDDGYARRHESVQSGPFVMLAVSDTGTGMPPDVRRRIFEPFFTTKGIGKGTGMGLATVYGIVKQSGGHVWVYSEVGHGSTFKVYLPRIVQGASDREAFQDEPPVARGDETVLLVEDEELVRRLARRALEACGYAVLEASDASQALAFSEGGAAPIDIVVTDVIMPGMSGRELVKQLSAARPGLRILYMSGYTDNAIAHRGILDEGTHFIQKPFTMRALARKVRDVLDAL